MISTSRKQLGMGKDMEQVAERGEVGVDKVGMCGLQMRIFTFSLLRFLINNKIMWCSMANVIL